MSLLKLPFLLLSAVFHHAALYIPQTPAPEDKIMGTSVRERMWAHLAIPCTSFLKVVTWLAALAESLVIVRSLPHDTPLWQSDTAASRVLDALGPVEASRLTASFVVGALLVIAGGAIRIQCFRTLGPMFTVQQCIRKEHKLVTTGPYAIVRHPGYASLLMCIFGSCVVYATPGSWVRTSGVLELPWVREVFAGWYLIMALSAVTLFYRSEEEDKFLSDRFGREWDGWARRVRYKLLPFVY